jgi:hypothetical protein
MLMPDGKLVMHGRTCPLMASSSTWMILPSVNALVAAALHRVMPLQ